MSDRLNSTIRNLRDFAPAVYERHDVQWLIEQVIRLRAQRQEQKKEIKLLRTDYNKLVNKYNELGASWRENEEELDKAETLVGKLITHIEGARMLCRNDPASEVYSSQVKEAVDVLTTALKLTDL